MKHLRKIASQLECNEVLVDFTLEMGLPHHRVLNFLHRRMLGTDRATQWGEKTWKVNLTQGMITRSCREDPIDFVKYS